MVEHIIMERDLILLMGATNGGQLFCLLVYCKCLSVYLFVIYIHVLLTNTTIQLSANMVHMLVQQYTALVL